MSKWPIFWKELIAQSVEPVYTPLETQGLLLVLYFASKERLMLALLIGISVTLLQYVLTRKKSAA